MKNLSITFVVLLCAFRVASQTPPFNPNSGPITTKSLGGGTSTCDTANETTHCIDFIDLKKFHGQSAQEQQASEWCWVAGISMIFAQGGYRVNQARIVKEAYGYIANVPSGTGERISKEIDRPWIDDDKKPFRSSIVGLWDSSAPNGKGNVRTQLPDFTRLDITPEIGNGRPVLMGMRGHVVVIVGVDWYRDRFGMHFNSFTIWDPWPGKGEYPISGAALNEVQYIAAVRLEDQP